MTLNEAYDLISAQRKSLESLNDTRWTHGTYEYRLRYVGGISEFFTIDRREIGRRKYRYFRGFSARHMPNSNAVAQYIFDMFWRDGRLCITPRKR